MELKTLKLKSKTELIQICKNKNLKGYSKFNKNELIKHIKTYNKKGAGEHNSKHKFEKNEELKEIVNIYHTLITQKDRGADKGYIVKTSSNYIQSDFKTYLEKKHNSYEKSKNFFLIHTDYIIDYYGEINNWDVSSITDMSRLFAEKSFNEDISNWDVSSVTNMNGMFSLASSFNQSLDSWNVSSVTDMSAMFYNASAFNQPLNSWNVSSVKNMSNMFSGATSFNRPLDSWDVSSVSNMDSMFVHAESFNQSLNSWNVSSVTNMISMFGGASSFNNPLNSWNVSSVTEMSGMFERAYSFNQPLNSWDVSSVTEMNDMFFRASKFNQPLNSWNVSSVIDMQSMFRDAKSFNQPLNSWDVSSVKNMRYMFKGASLFNQPLNSWDVSSVENMKGMFKEAESFNQVLNSWQVRSDCTINLMFNGCPSLQPNWSLNMLSENIVIKKNMLLSNNKNTCNTKLFDKIIKQEDISLRNKRFKFENQTGIDAGGLTRTVYDIFFRTYLDKFFDLKDDNFYILKEKQPKIDLTVATNKLLILSEKAKVNIILPINPELIEFVTIENKNGNKNENNKVLIKNYNNLIKLYNKNKYVIKNGFNLSNKNYAIKAYYDNITLSDLMATSLNNKNTNYNFETNNKKWTNTEKKEIYLRLYIKKFGFETTKQFMLMINFIGDYVLKKSYNFKNEISFNKEDFFKRIKIVKPNNLSNRAINIPNNINNNFINQNPNLKLLINYISKSDENREKFNIWITGSKYCEANIKLFVSNLKNSNPYSVHTCFYYVDVYRTEDVINNNYLNKQINYNIKNSKFSN